MRSGGSRDLRQYNRQPVKAGVQVYAESDRGYGTVVEGRCHDLSEGGLQMTVWTPMEPRQRVTIKVDALKIHTSGFIRYCRRGAAGFKAGVEFSAKLRSLRL